MQKKSAEAKRIKKKRFPKKHCLAYICPHLKSGRINLVELVEITVDNGVLRQSILRASCHHNCSRNLFSCCSLVINLLRGGNKQIIMSCTLCYLSSIQTQLFGN